MKLDFALVMRILLAIKEAEETVKGGATKKEKAIALVTLGAKNAAEMSPKAKEAIGGFIDAAVAVQNGIDGR